MTLLSALKRRFGNTKTTPLQPQTPRAAEPEPEQIVIPELTVAEALAARQNGASLVILDCREEWERRQARIEGSLHIPMNQTPQRLSELDPETEIVVVCAHGNRSYSVAGYLIEHGLKARNLIGGMAAWQAAGGEVESDYPRRSPR